MEFTFEMEYTPHILTTMQRAIRLTLQEERDKKSKVIAVFFIVAAIFIMVTAQKFGYRQILAGIVIALFIVYLLFQDQISGFMAGSKIPKNMKKVTWTFRDDGFFSTSEAGNSGFDYETIFAMIETENCMVLCFADSQAQIIDMRGIQGGSVQDFRRLLRKKTNLTLQTL